MNERRERESRERERESGKAGRKKWMDGSFGSVDDDNGTGFIQSLLIPIDCIENIQSGRQNFLIYGWSLSSPSFAVVVPRKCQIPQGYSFSVDLKN